MAISFSVSAATLEGVDDSVYPPVFTFKHEGKLYKCTPVIVGVYDVACVGEDGEKYIFRKVLPQEGFILEI